MDKCTGLWITQWDKLWTGISVSTGLFAGIKIGIENILWTKLGYGLWTRLRSRLSTGI